MHRISHRMTMAHVGLMTASQHARTRALHAAERRLDQLRDDTGAQAAEYAMLGGVSAAACGGLITLLSNPETLRVVVDAILDTLRGAVGSWF